MTDVSLCKTCGETKPVRQFYLHRGKPRAECKTCTSERNKRSYTINDNRFNSNADHKLKNPEYYVAYAKQYYQDNQQKLIEQQRARNSSILGRARLLYRGAKLRAEKKFIPFDLNIHRIIMALERGKCERSGVDFDLSGSSGTWRNRYAPSIDRIVGEKGYITSNVQIVCNFYNTGKNEFTDAEFIAFCRKVVEYNS